MTKQTIGYRKWASMRRRCNDPKHPAWKWYGGRGLTVCARWSERVTGFRNFIADMGEPPAGLWLERIDNDKGYEPGNCRWATPKEQAANRRKRGPIAGSLRQRATEAGLNYLTVWQRVNKLGWPIERALLP